MVESKQAAVTADLANLNSQAKAKKQHLAVLEALEGYIQAASPEKLEELITEIPKLLEETKLGSYSPDLIRIYIFKQLTGGTLNVLKCGNCGAGFFVNKPASSTGYKCPVCGFIYKIEVDKNEIDILKATLAHAEPQTVIYSTEVKIEPLSAKVPSESDATGKPRGIGKNIV